MRVSITGGMEAIPQNSPAVPPPSTATSQSITRGRSWNWLALPARVFLGGLAELFPNQRDEELAAAGANGWRPDAPDAYCRRCGATCAPQAVTERGCPFCVEEPLPWDRIVRLSAYVDPVDRWVRAMKFGKQWTWSDWAGRTLAGAVGEARREQTIVTPVPMHFFRRLHRGYNQAELIAGAFARALGWPAAPLLRRVRHTMPQTKVAPSARAQNIRGSFAIKHIDLAGWDVWLIDDVKTSGATAGVCARLLKKAGAARVNLAVMAVGDPKNAGFQRK